MARWRLRRLVASTLPITVTSMLALVVSLFVATPPTALAHAGLERSIPAPNSVLEVAPDDVVLDFDEAVEPDLASIDLFDSEARPVEINAAQASDGDDSIVLASLPDLADGTYAVVWRVASRDGHVVTGAFSFQVGTGGPVAPDDGALVDQVQQGASASPGVGRAATVTRLAVFIGLVVLLGAGFHALTAVAALTMATATRRLLGIGAVLTVVGSVASFGLHGAAVVAGSLGDALSPDVWGKVAGTRTGRALLVRTLLAVMLSILLVRLVDRRAAWWQLLAVLGAVGLLFTLPAAGHASAATPPALWVSVDVVHLVSIALWLGGLVLFAAGGRAWLRSDEAVPTVRRFSAMSLVLVPVIVATGALQTFELAGGIDTLIDTGWGRRLLVKVSLVTLLVAVGAVSRWVLHHVGAVGLRRTIVLEAVVGVLVLGVTASMVAMPPRLLAEARVFNVTLAQAGLIADITVTPGRVGSNEMHIVLTPPGGSLQPVVGTTARMALPGRDLPAQPVTITPDGPNHYTGVITLAYSGDWELDVVVELAPGNTVLLSTVVPIP